MKIFLLWLGMMLSLVGQGLVRVENTTLAFPENTPVSAGLQWESAFGNIGFEAPLAIRTVPGEGDVVYVVEKTGRVQRVTQRADGSWRKSVFFHVRDLPREAGKPVRRFQSGGERGLLSIAFHPNYRTNGWMYFFYSFAATDAGTWRNYQEVARVTVRNGTVDPSSYQPMITQLDREANHNGGDLHFGEDGYLYISVGDEGGGDDQYDNGNHIDKNFFCGILRIDVDRRPGSLAPNAHSQPGTAFPSAVRAGTYRIPADNPFVGATVHQGESVNPQRVRTEFWVAGLRNPWRFSFDEDTGRCFVGDVGQGAREEINIVSAGDDCGWSRREGTIAFRRGPAGSSAAAGGTFLEPIHDYPRTDGRSVTGGLVYRGNRLPGLVGRYIFSDYASGQVWNLREGNGGNWVRASLPSRGGIAGFGVAPGNGDLLACDLGGEVLRLVRAPSSDPAPERLSQTGIFKNLRTLEVEDGIYGYDVNLPFWSDHADKKRWFAMPDATSQVDFSAEGPWSFPAGLVWVKHFDLERVRGNAASSRPLETRVLVKTAEGSYGLSYRWREDGSDADLVGEEGVSVDLPIVVNGQDRLQSWQFPSRVDCQRCHLPTNNEALSFHTAQLNRGGQIEALWNAGFIRGLSEAPDPSQLRAHPALGDESVSREARVRAYLDVNCSMCHRRDAGTTPGNFEARSLVRTDHAGLIWGRLANTAGDEWNRVVRPGQVERSMLLTRLSNGNLRMPPLSSTVEDTEAQALIRDWIMEDLPTRRSYWQAVADLPADLRGEDDDGDGDGLSNYMEHLFGSDPTRGDSRFNMDVSTDEVSFALPANRGVTVEGSEDLVNWAPLAVPGNTSQISPSGGMRTLSFPERNELYLRLRVQEP